MENHNNNILAIMNAFYVSKGCRVTDKQICNTVIPTGRYPLHLLSHWGKISLYDAASDVYDNAISNSGCFCPFVKPDILEANSSIKSLSLKYLDLDAWRTSSNKKELIISEGDIRSFLNNFFLSMSSTRLHHYHDDSIVLHHSLSSRRILNRRISRPFIYIDKNLTKLCRDYLFNCGVGLVSVKSRLAILDKHFSRNASVLEKAIFLMIPSIFIEHIDLFMQMLDMLNLPDRIRISFDTSGWVGDPCFHFLMMRHSEKHVGIQHGGGYLLQRQIPEHIQLERSCYDDFLFWAPFSPTVEPLRFISPITQTIVQQCNDIATVIVTTVRTLVIRAHTKNKVVAVLPLSILADNEEFLNRLTDLKIDSLHVKIHPAEKHKSKYIRRFRAMHFIGDTRLEYTTKYNNAFFLVYSIEHTFLYYAILQRKALLVVVDGCNDLIESYRDRPVAVEFLTELRSLGLLLNVDELTPGIFSLKGEMESKRNISRMHYKINKKYLKRYIEDSLKS
jgi:hypothetical protein